MVLILLAVACLSPATAVVASPSPASFYTPWTPPPYLRPPYYSPGFPLYGRPFSGYPAYGPWPYNDQNIQSSVWNKLAQDPFLTPNTIQIEVHHGVVVLTGSVDTWQQRHRAEIDAYAAGARLVINRLKVAFPW